MHTQKDAVVSSIDRHKIETQMKKINNKIEQECAMATKTRRARVSGSGRKSVQNNRKSRAQSSTGAHSAAHSNINASCVISSNKYAFFKFHFWLCGLFQCFACVFFFFFNFCTGAHARCKFFAFSFEFALYMRMMIGHVYDVNNNGNNRKSSYNFCIWATWCSLRTLVMMMMAWH